MTGNVGKKALVAGLLGTALVFPAHSALSESLVSLPSVEPSPTLYFGLGCLAGAAGAGCISLVSYLIYTRKSHTKNLDTVYEYDQASEIVSTPSVSRTSSYDGVRRASQSVATSQALAADVLPCVDNAQLPEASVPQHITHDLVEIAENYVRQKTFKERLATRAEGVAKILAERLGAHNFDDLPVIERADGTVGDVGTAWWNARLGETVRRVGDFSSGEYVEPTDTSVSAKTDQPSGISPSAFDLHFGNTQYLASAQAMSSDRFAVSDNVRSSIDTFKRAESIARAVPEVNIGAYPALRTADELDHKDLWEEALKSMSQKEISSEPMRIPLVSQMTSTQQSIAEESTNQDPVSAKDMACPQALKASSNEFIDIVGEADTLDEVDNLAEKTVHITPAPAENSENSQMTKGISHSHASIYVEQMSDTPHTYRTPSTTLTLLEGGSQRLFKLDNVAKLAHTSVYQIQASSKSVDEVLDEAYDKAYDKACLSHAQNSDVQLSHVQPPHTNKVGAYITAPKHLRARRHQTKSVLPPRHMTYVAKKEA